MSMRQMRQFLARFTGHDLLHGMRIPRYKFTITLLPVVSFWVVDIIWILILREEGFREH